MIHAHISKQRAVPLWAVIGAPFLGVPFMVALLSFTVPAERAPAMESEAQTEQVEVQTVEHPIDLDGDCRVTPPYRG